MSKYFKLRRFKIQYPIDALQVDETKDGDWVHYRDARDEIKDLERQLEKKEKMIKSFYKARHEFLLIEIEELKNIRNKTRFPDHACKMLNNRILELERIYNLHKEKGEDE